MPGDVEVLGLVATLRRAAGSPRPLYRLSEQRFALLLPRTSRATAGELVLLATCGSGPSFDWGVGTLSAAGPSAARDVGLITVLADADLQIRRRDMTHATGALARRKRSGALTATAAAVALLGGAAFAIDAGSPGGLPQAALHAHAATGVPGSHGSGTADESNHVTPPSGSTTPPHESGGAPTGSAAVPVAEVTPPAAQPAPALPVALVSAPVPGPAPVPAPAAVVTTPPPAPSTPPALVSQVVKEAKHAVPWSKGHHTARS